MRGKLDDKYEDILEMRAAGKTYRQIAEKYGCSPSTVSSAVDRRIMHEHREKDLLRLAEEHPDAIETLGLSIRPYNSLKRAGYKRITDVVEDYQTKGGANWFLGIRNFGSESLIELLELLQRRGHDLEPHAPKPERASPKYNMREDVDARDPVECRFSAIEKQNEEMREMLYDLCQTIADVMGEIPQEALVDIGIEANAIIGRLNGESPT